MGYLSTALAIQEACMPGTVTERFARMRHPFRAAMAILVFAATAMVVQAAEPQPKPPPGFADQKLARIANPTSIAFLHDGRALVGDQSGKLYLWKEGPSSVSLVQDIGPLICTKSDAGLLGLAVDPHVNADGSEYYYMYFTMRGKGATINEQCPRSGNETPDSPFERLSRFTLKDGALVEGSEFIVLDHIPTRIQDHTGGGMFFAQDGYLYVSTGDGDQPQKAKDTDSLRGKILRINPATGDGVPGNPYFSAANAVQCGKPDNLQYEQGKPCREIFARGLRHPWRIALKPGTDPNNVEFYINDVGKQTWEEINAGKAGMDYGWDKREGPCKFETRCVTTDQGTAPAAPGDPIFSYMHTSDANPAFKNCAAITGAAFVPPGVWPKQYDNVYLFADYTCGRMWRLDPNAKGGYTASVFSDGILGSGVTSGSSITTMTFGPASDPAHPGKMTRALYYGVYNGGGQLRRVLYTEGLNQPPTAAISADKTFGGAPLTVTFSGAQSSDPEGDALTYDWDFGDGQTSTGNATPTRQHTYSANGSYTASLVVRDSKGNASEPASMRIDVGNSPPVPTIQSPAPDFTFKVGQTVTLIGSATDPDESGPLPDTALTWHVLRHHDQHTHEELLPTQGNNIVIPMTEPEGLSASKSSYLEIQLTATDPQGRTSTVTQTLMPHLVDLTFRTEPAGLQLVADDTIINGEGTATSWENYAFNVSAPTQQDASGQWMVFDHWADAAATHAAAMRRIPAGYWPQHDGHNDAVEPTREIVTPAAPTTYVAVFKPLAVQAESPEVRASLNAGVANIAVQLTAASTEPVTVTYTTEDGTATAGVDYTATSGTLTFAPGQTSMVVSVPLIKHEEALNKTFMLVLSDPVQAALGTPSRVTVTITNIATGPALRLYLPLMRQ
jgi:glucose/arabinose dehydrogenase/PKD repeat protein